MEQLALEVFDLDGQGSQYAYLEPDASITITDTSEIFDSGDIWTHNFQLNIPANAHLFGTSGELHGSRLHEQINKRRARLWVMGLPLYYGYLRLDDEVDVDEDGNVDVSFESGQKTFKDMIEGAKANQVPLMNDLLIGMAVDRERSMENKQVTITFESTELPASALYPRGGTEVVCRLNGIRDLCQMFPKFVRPDGTWYNTVSGSSFTIARNELVNTDYPYSDAHPYCNIKIGYRKYEYTADGNSSELTKKALREYQLKNP